MGSDQVRRGPDIQLAPPPQWGMASYRPKAPDHVVRGLLHGAVLATWVWCELAPVGRRHDGDGEGAGHRVVVPGFCPVCPVVHR